MALRVVVLPAALAPRSATAFPSGTSREIPFRNHDHIVVDNLDILYLEHGTCFLVCKRGEHVALVVVLQAPKAPVRVQVPVLGTEIDRW